MWYSLPEEDSAADLLNESWRLFYRLSDSLQSLVFPRAPLPVESQLTWAAILYKRALRDSRINNFLLSQQEVPMHQMGDTTHTPHSSDFNMTVPVPA